MQIGVVGLGLIGGSLARAVKKYTGHTVCGVDRDKSVLAAAYAAGAIDCDTDVSGSSERTDQSTIDTAFYRQVF